MVSFNIDSIAKEGNPQQYDLFIGLSERFLRAKNVTFNIDLHTAWLSTKRINRLRYSNGGGVINVEIGAKSPVKIY